MKTTYFRKNKRPGKKKNHIKIIGGKWKGRKLPFTDHPDLRPTLSRTKETLFNWLRPHITGSKCIDLFAGSGSLGFEALSQGALEVTIIEKDRKTFECLVENSSDFNARTKFHHGDAIDFLNRTTESYDIAFLDPPYSMPDLIDSAIQQMTQKKLITNLLYVEMIDSERLLKIAEANSLVLRKSSRNGNAQCALFEMKEKSKTKNRDVS